MVLDFVVNGVVGVRQGNRSARMAPHGAFRCDGDDRWVTVACWDDDDWARLAAVLGLDEVTTQKWAKSADRLADVEAVEALVEAWTATRSAGEVVEALQDAGIERRRWPTSATPTTTRSSSTEGTSLRSTTRAWVAATTSATAFACSDASAGYVRTSPLLGEHNEYVFGEFLGLSAAERERLGADGAVRVAGLRTGRSRARHRSLHEPVALLLELLL